MLLPRAEIQAIIKRMAFKAVPHLPREHQIDWVARKVNAEAAKPVEVGTVKNWWYARPDDETGVDSRHMDWARARSRTISANDNAVGRGRLPSPPSLIAA